MNATQTSRDREGAVSERGFALLLIFVLAASVAIMLYTQMPRVAFESERDKEQLLIDRGEQYKRAIQLFYAENRRFPARIEDLENTNNRRFLRRRYVDPFTGKDEWRLIHTNGMFLTDSLVQKPPANPANSSGDQNQTLALVGAPGTPNPLQNGSSTPTPPAPASAANPGARQPVNAAVLARPSDRPIMPNAGAFPGSFAPPTPPVNSGYIDPASYPPITLFPNGYNAPSQQPVQPVQAGIQPGGQFQPGVQPGFPQPVPFQQGQFQQGQFQPGIAQPGQFQPGLPQPLPFNTPQTPDPNGNPAGQTSVFPPFVPNPPNGSTPPFGQPVGQVPGLNQNSANQFPQQAPNPILPSPVPVDPNGAQNPVQQQPPFPVPPAQFPNNRFPNNQFPNSQYPPAAAPGAPAPPNQALNLINQILTTPRQPPPGVGAAPAGNQAVGGGIAGVASTFEGATIKSYGEKTKYQEWEFVFQLQQQQGVPGAGANPLQNGAQNANNPNNPNGAGSNTNPGGAIPGQQLFTPPQGQTPIPPGLAPPQ